MAASLIRPAAARHRRRSRGTSMVRLLPAAALLLHAAAASAEPVPSKPVLERNNLYLSSAGFRIQFANDPAGQKALRALPAHRFVTEGSGEALRYYYAEPQHCVCVFVGTKKAYDSYRNMVSQPLERTHVPADYKTQAGVLLSGQPLRQSTKGDPTTLADYLSVLRPSY